MSDEDVAALLRSDRQLVVIEAAAGCGKTYQGACYAKDAADCIGAGRVLILAHTHAACSVFADRTRASRAKVEIKTIDAFLMQIASAYHQALGLPHDLSTWAWRDNGTGFSTIAQKVATYLHAQPMVATALAARYPIVICDEHQDSSADQHQSVMALYRNGAKLRIFGDPLQRIYGGHSQKAVKADLARWQSLKEEAAHAVLDTPHRWKEANVELGAWIQWARQRLIMEQTIDLSAQTPTGVNVIVANNLATLRAVYQLSKEQRRPIDQLVNSLGQVMVLASQNDMVSALRKYWGRRLPIWEGHTREALSRLVTDLLDAHGNAGRLALGLINFVSGISVGFTPRSHGDRLLYEISENCARATTGKPANIQAIAREILGDPSHRGVARALGMVRDFVRARSSGFADIYIDYPVELSDAIQLGAFADIEEGFAEINRRRSYSRPSPPPHTISSVHKAKGLECENAMVMPCDRAQFSSTTYARCRLYVALSRARQSLTLVVPDTNTSPLISL